MSDPNVDPELQAMQQVIKALESLKDDARTRVLAYVFQRLGLSAPSASSSQPPTLPLGADTPLPPLAITAATAPVTDIRSLKEVKHPKSDNQMAALVAYYLKELASASDRKDVISHDDIEKYFKQAGHPLPKRLAMTLSNAKNAGYFDPAGSGLFKLNPVGHNLVVHGMSPSSQTGGAQSRGARKSK